jgi:undecaprenyl-phosphate alpha-N-acetylglucosaminyl 1-phosphatetransferase
MAFKTELWQANLIALVSAFVAIKLLRPVAVYFGLVDVPSGRKQHEGQIPLIGGLSVYIGVLVAILTIFPIHDKLFYLLVSASLLLLAGLVDDLRNLGVWVRILIQILACVIMIKGANIYVDELGDLFGFGPIHLGLWAVPFTVVAVIGLVNAFNMSDGIDGLAGSLALVAILGIFGFETISGNYRFFDFLIVMSAALIPYLLTNLTIISKRKIFLGDAGSMFIGFVLAWVLIELSQGAGTPSQAIQPMNVVWCIALPVIDSFAVIIKRLKARRSPFYPDRSHFHHVLMDKGLGPRQALFIMILLALGLAALGWVLQLLAPQMSAVMFALVTGLYIIWVRQSGWHQGVSPQKTKKNS